MTRRVLALVAAGAAALTLCVGCGDGGSGAPSGSDQVTSELNQLQSTLDSVSAQVSADEAP